MQNSKGFSLIELLVVAVILALVIALTTLFFLEQVNRARGSTLMSEARVVYLTAKIVMIENTVITPPIADEDYMKGLTGRIWGTLGVQAQISNRMRVLLGGDIILSDEPSEEAACVEFILQDGVIVSMDFQKVIGNRLYTVTIADTEDGGDRQATVRYERI